MKLKIKRADHIKMETTKVGDEERQKEEEWKAGWSR